MSLVHIKGFIFGAGFSPGRVMDRCHTPPASVENKDHVSTPPFFLLCSFSTCSSCCQRLIRSWQTRWGASFLNETTSNTLIQTLTTALCSGSYFKSDYLHFHWDGSDQSVREVQVVLMFFKLFWEGYFCIDFIWSVNKTFFWFISVYWSIITWLNEQTSCKPREA